MSVKIGEEFEGFASIGEYLESFPWQSRSTRHAAELSLAATHPQNELDIYCDVCGRMEKASFNLATHPEETPNWREELACRGCGLISRVRFSVRLLESVAVDAAATLYLTEQTTPVYAALLRRMPRLHGSEFLPDSAVKRSHLRQYLRDLTGNPAAELRHEDVTALSFDSGSQDGVLTMDVLEHVPNHNAALREFHRVLKPGGRLVITVPFAEATSESLLRARIVDGDIEHLVEPEYHGDPMSDDGCLAFHTFGWSLLDDIRAAGFADAMLVDGWCPARGFLGFVGAIVAFRE
ncbi:MAG: methyltransferase domain-containing protein [Lysobacteraceae bacterium]